MADTTFIYGLVDPNTRELRYVGRANIIARRHREHILEAQAGVHGPRGEWLRSLLAQGQEPETVILEEVAKRDAPCAEEKWIAHYKQATGGLCNIRTVCAPMETDTRPPRRAQPPTNMPMTAQDLVRIRSRLDISKRKLAILLGVDPSLITRWMKGERPIPIYIDHAIRNIAFPPQGP